MNPTINLLLFFSYFAEDVKIKNFENFMFYAFMLYSKSSNKVMTKIYVFIYLINHEVMFCL